ncbi:hypothetical protein EDEG_01051 [Edhazardia aedis USNM 41457]|uniref:RPN1 N-terminal domain-containing protein n=1 Tax=Edhazardia aedis (strain USNM 41457) TaxID=1003232 RepID=J9DAI5_EDHAE|nr:hypothetical protein EDEG_01051 [Edhazardia aedis USNM 41457]|eukprot:EJW04761.1 hypothetical protein EDEG_01051 [Edhazardia aedis USNM 41457]
MLENIIANLQSDDRDLRKKTFLYMIYMDGYDLVKLNAQLVEVYKNKHSLCEYELDVLSDIVDSFFLYVRPDRNHYPSSFVTTVKTKLFETFFTEDMLTNLIYHRKENKKVPLKYSTNKRICSLVFALVFKVISGHKIFVGYDYLKELSGVYLIPFLLNDKNSYYKLLAYIEPICEVQYNFDVSLNACLMKRDFIPFIIYFLRYESSIPLFDKKGNRISEYISDEKNILNSNLSDKSIIQNDQIYNSEYELFSATRFLEFQEFFDKSIDDFINCNTLDEKTFVETANEEDRLFFDEIAHSYTNAILTNICDLYLNALNKLSNQKFTLFNYRNLRFSIVLDYVFRNCKYSEFLQLIFMVNKAKIMMFSDRYIRKMIDFRRNQGSAGICLKCCKKNSCKAIKEWDEIKPEKKQELSSDTIYNLVKYGVNLLNLNTNSDLEIVVCQSCYEENEREILMGLWDYEVVSKILNDRYVSTANQLLHEHLKITNPINLDPYLMYYNNLNNTFLYSDLSFLSLINGFLNFGFTFDDFFCSERFPLDFKNINSDDNKDFISIFGSIGMLRKNGIIKFSICQFNEKNELTELDILGVEKTEMDQKNRIKEYLAKKGVKNMPSDREISKYINLNEYLKSLLKTEEFSNKKAGLFLALAISETIYGDSLHYYNQENILTQRLESNTTSFTQADENKLKMMFGDHTDIHGSEKYGEKSSGMLCDYILKYLPCCSIYQEVSSMMALHMMYCDTKIKNKNLQKEILDRTLSKNVIASSWAMFALGSIYTGNYCDKIDSYALQWFYSWYHNDPKSPFFPLGMLGISLLFIGRNDLVQKKSNIKLPKEIDFLCEAMGFMYTSDPSIRKKMSKTYNNIIENDIYKHKFYTSDELKNYIDISDPIYNNILQEKNNTKELDQDGEQTYKNYLICFSLLSIALLGLSSHQARLDSKAILLKLQEHDKSDFIPLCVALLYASEPVDSMITYLTDLFFKSSNPRNVILALGIIGAGTKNKNIIDFLHTQKVSCANNQYKNLIRITMSLCNMGKGTLSISPNISEGTIINKKCLINLLSIVCLFMNKDSCPLTEDFDFLFLLFAGAVHNKYVSVFDSNLKIIKKDIIVEKLGDEYYREFSDERILNHIACLEINERANIEYYRTFSAIDIHIFDDEKKE